MIKENTGGEERKEGGKGGRRGRINGNIIKLLSDNLENVSRTWQRSATI